ncbi:FAD:protein FMN transferase [Nibricoccus sp. IMCC34717]|uniref:FAD:protein FMN transferase n=1 Tax=Nibricoccus sp. IMCC34717 TaxID=3034021 RepID=UPI00384F1C25
MIIQPAIRRVEEHQRLGEAVGPLRTVRWRALGTDCMLQFPEAAGEAGNAFARAVIDWVAAFEAKFSRFRSDSVISRINSSAGEWVAIDAETERVLDVCATVHFLTRGILDVSAFPLQQLWDYRNPPPRLPSEAEVARARERVGWHRVERAPGKVRLPLPGMGLDLGGWGKEYAVDAAASLAASHGIANVLIDFGHDLRALAPPPGRPAWHIGLEDPRKPGTPRGSIAVFQRGVASSGDYQRGFTLEGRRFGHIVDPRTGWPVSNGCDQVTVIAPTCLQAGILSTAAFVLGEREGLSLIQETMGCEGLIVRGASRHQTRGFFNYVVSET